MTGPVKTIAVLTALPGRETELRELLDGLIGPSRAEPGNIRYELWSDVDSERIFVLDELYADRDALAAHHASAHFGHYRAHVGSLAERAAYSLAPLSIG